ncbi:outer mitochondrial transmembrane helix translocase [Trifolium repens]|nr:outer mitochondrial transmembrane helix translocase [Trifolium repens]
MNKLFGESQKLVAAIFSLANKLQPAIIFIDEVDSFLGQRRQSDHEAMKNMKTEFMALWDGFTTNKNAQVMVLAATNRPSELDEAILRRLHLFDLCKKAAYYPIRELLNDENKGIQYCEPRPLSQLDLEKARSTSRKTMVAANEYSRMKAQSSSRQPFSGESGDYEVQAAIKEISRLMGSHAINIQLVSRDP